MEEDVCSICGLDTKCGIQDKSVFLCDRCYSEFHAKCLEANSVVRESDENWICSLCKEEIQEVPWGESTFIRSKNFCYSPSKPLDLAFEECKLNGLMMVQKVFPYEVLRQVIMVYFLC